MKDSLHASVLDGDSGLSLEVVTSPENGTAKLRYVTGPQGHRKIEFTEPITWESLRYAAKVLSQAARNIEPEADAGGDK